MGRDAADGSWTLLTAHGRTLVEIARNPESRMVDLAAVVGVTERTAQAIVADLEAAGFVTHERVGRRNRYSLNPAHAFRHSAQDGHVVGPFLELLATTPANEGSPTTENAR
jgi:DNA-binding IclR family transcriptional regulator